MTSALLTALALASFPLYLACEDKPASLNLPPFEKEVYLSVTAKWAGECVDVTVVTNLPDGTAYWLRASGWTDANRSIRRSCHALGDSEVDFVVTGSPMHHRRLFCHLIRSARKLGNSYDGLAFRAGVHPGEHFVRRAQGEVQALPVKIKRQQRRVGRNGALLKGPLSWKDRSGDVTLKSIRSRTFILAPFPTVSAAEPDDEAGADDE